MKTAYGLVIAAAGFFLGSAAFFMGGLKLYTEIMKEKSQRERRSK